MRAMTRRHRTRSGGATTRAELPRAAGIAPGRFLYTCRAGFEGDLLDDLARHAPRERAAVLAPALVVSEREPKLSAGRIDLVFARQGMRVTELIEGAELAERAAAAVARAVPPGRAFALHVWVPDTDAANRLASAAQALFAAVAAELTRTAPELASQRVSAEVARREGGVLVQICLPDRARAIVGAVSATEALSLAPGGRERMRVPADAPARSAMKLAEALSWLGVGPEAGEVVADLGAAPGGWTRVLLERRARVVAVDPAELAPEIAKLRGVTHVKASAFDYAPDEPVDWLVCDMAWRPLEVAALVAKWGRKRWARAVVLNVKLPMKRKVEMVERIRGLLADSGFTGLRTRQLYHDREEITLMAHVR